MISTVIETLDRCTFYSVKTVHTISCKFLKINILLSLILGTVQNVNKIFMSDKLVISFINDAIEFLKNKNPESGRSCCKTFFVRKTIALKISVIGIEKTGNGDNIYRETKESLWIKKT